MLLAVTCLASFPTTLTKKDLDRPTPGKVRYNNEQEKGLCMTTVQGRGVTNVTISE